MEPEQFEVSLPEEKLVDLRRRLRATNWPEPIGADDWVYGVPADWLREMARYWADNWDWQTEADRINRWSHFRVNVDGIPIHYMHAPASQPDSPAIILTHGWPWTFWDYQHLIGPLSDPASNGSPDAQAFNVYVPSLPGFGLSTPLYTAGIDVPRVAGLWVKLMTDVLGYDQFCAHGGDWGALITGYLAHAYANRVTGAHLALTLIPWVNRSDLFPEAFADNEQWMVKRNTESEPHITSHGTVHRLDPQTLGYALTDSPVGTAAWIWERRRNWSDCDGVVENVFSKDHLCTTAALYWCTGAINSSLRIYHEQSKSAWAPVHKRTPTLEAPTGFAVFPKDVVHMPRRVLEEQCNMTRYSVMPRGGHFGAFEAPDDLVSEIRSFFGRHL